jgi:hypothetical protein
VINWVAPSLFRTHIGRRPKNLAGLSCGALLARVLTFYCFGQAEIQDLNLPLRCNLDITRLQVAVYDTIIVGCRDGLGNLKRD